MKQNRILSLILALALLLTLAIPTVVFANDDNGEPEEIAEVTAAQTEEQAEEEEQTGEESEEDTNLTAAQTEEEEQDNEEAEENSEPNSNLNEEEQQNDEGEEQPEIIASAIPVITQQPVDASGAANQLVTFSITATNAESYQWQYSQDNGENWVDCGTKLYTGAKSDTVTVKVTATRNGWLFRCVVNGDGQTVESNGAKLTLTAAGASITQQPVDASGAANQTVTFSVTAQNAESYKWQYSQDNGANWTDCSTKLYTGALTNTVTVKVTATRNGWLFRCVVNGGGQTVESNGAKLTLTAAGASITQQPVDASGAANQTVTFSVTAQNAESYKWQYSQDNGANWTDCSTKLYTGAKTDTVTVKVTSARNGWLFRCVVEGGGKTVESNGAKLTLTAAGASITAQPVDASGAANQTVTFSVTAQNAESYQWQYSSDNGATWTNCTTKLYTGATSATVTVKVTATRNGWLFRCVVEGGGKTVESNGAKLTLAAEAKITAQPVDASGAVNELVTFSVTAQNAESYKWQYSSDNGTTWNDCSTKLYTGAKTDTVTVKVTSARSGWLFRCVVEGGGKTVESDGATVTLAAEAKITAQPVDASGAANKLVTFSVTAQNAESYKWQYSSDNGTTWNDCSTKLYTGAKTDTVTVKVTSARNGWLFRCVVEGGGKTVESNGAKLTLAAEAKITVQPEDAVGAANELVTFSVTAENAESYKWQYSSDNGTTWNDCSTKLYTGAKTDTVTVKVTATRNGWLFRCVVEGGGKTVESNGAKLTLDNTFVVDDVTYETLTASTCAVKAYAGTAASLEIPEIVQDKTVVEIGEEAFMDNTTLVSIDLPDSITVIRARAFKGCTSLSEMR